MAIFAAIWIEKWVAGYKSGKTILGIVCVILLVGALCIQIHLLQADVKVRGDIVSPYEEGQIRKMSNWLNEYMHREGIHTVCVPGGLTTHKIVRRIWMYLPGYYHFYAVGGAARSPAYINKGVYDMVMLAGRDGLSGNTKAVLVSLGRLDEHRFINDVALELIHSNQNPAVYFYLITVPAV